MYDGKFNSTEILVKIKTMFSLYALLWDSPKKLQNLQTEHY